MQPRNATLSSTVVKSATSAASRLAAASPRRHLNPATMEIVIDRNAAAAAAARNVTVDEHNDKSHAQRGARN